VSVLKRVDWLVGSTVLASIGATWAVLVALDAFAILIGRLGSANYTVATAFAYIAWTIPRRMVEMFDSAAAIGAILGLGAQAPTSELTAMRAGGMSKLRIAQGAALGIAALLVLVMLMGETLAPIGEARARALASGVKSQDLLATGRTGLWAREGAHIIMNARGGTVGPDGISLSDVRLFEFNPDGSLAGITHAKRADHRGERWVMNEQTRYALGAEDLTSTSTPQAPWDTALDPRVLSVSMVDPRYLSLRDLDRGIAHLEANRVDATPYRAAFWARVFYPLDVLALVLASLPFAFGALRSGGLGKRLFVGAVMTVSWYFFQKAAVNVAVVYGVDFRIAHLLPIALLAAIAYSYFKRTT
jgi:lipopolysaccharide export system permease protein